MFRQFCSDIPTEIKYKTNEKIITPMKRLNSLPIPHPVYIAIYILNRDSDDPIPLDDNICLNILKALEECNDDVSINVFFSLKNCVTFSFNFPLDCWECYVMFQKQQQ